MSWFSALIPKGPIGYWLTANPASKKTLRVDASGQVTAEDIVAADVTGLGTAATRDVPSSGNASNTQVVLGNDSRLGGGGGSSLTDTAVQTTTYTASAGQNVLLNASGMQSSATVTFQNGPNYMLFASGLPENGTEVTISNSGGALPGGVTAGTRYFITTSTGTIGSSGYTQLSLTRGGSAVDITTDGSGTNTATVISKQVSLPNSPSVGQSVRFTLVTTDSVRTWLPHFNGSTVNGLSDVGPYRLTQVGEWFEVKCTGSNAWQVTGRGKQPSVSVVFATVSRSLTNGYAENRLRYDAEQANCSGCTPSFGATDSGILIRRSGKYLVEATAQLGIFNGSTQANDTYTTVFKNSVNSSNVLAGSENISDTDRTVHRASCVENFVAGDVVFVTAKYSVGSMSTNVGSPANRPTLSVLEVS
jgi:hypothetical protein